MAQQTAHSHGEAPLPHQHSGGTGAAGGKQPLTGGGAPLSSTSTAASSQRR